MSCCYQVRFEAITKISIGAEDFINHVPEIASLSRLEVLKYAEDTFILPMRCGNKTVREPRQ